MQYGHFECLFFGQNLDFGAAAQYETTKDGVYKTYKMAVGGSNWSGSRDYRSSRGRPMHFGAVWVVP